MVLCGYRFAIFYLELKYLLTKYDFAPSWQDGSMIRTAQLLHLQKFDKLGAPHYLPLHKRMQEQEEKIYKRMKNSDSSCFVSPHLEKGHFFFSFLINCEKLQVHKNWNYIFFPPELHIIKDEIKTKPNYIFPFERSNSKEIVGCTSYKRQILNKTFKLKYESGPIKADSMLV